MTCSCASSSPNQYGLAKDINDNFSIYVYFNSSKITIKRPSQGAQSPAKKPHNPSPSFIPGSFRHIKGPS